MRPLVACCLLAGALPAGETIAANAWFAAGSTRLPAAGFDVAPGATVAMREQRLSAGIGIAGDVELGLDYAYTRYEYRALPGRNRDLHRLELPLTWRVARRGRVVEAVVAPGISASSNVFQDPFGRWSRDDVTLRLAIESRREWRDDWSLLLGAAWDRRFGRQRAYPVVGLHYDGPALAARLAFPDSRLELPLGNARSLNLRLAPAGHRWRVTSDELNDEFDYRVRAWRADLVLSLPVGGGLLLDLAGGFESDRRHWLTDDSGLRHEPRAGSEWLLGIGLRSRGAPLP